MSCRVVLPLILALVAGCSTTRVEWDYNETAVLTNMRTYALIGQHEDNKQSYDINSLLNKRVARAVDRELSAHGLKEVDSQDADVWVSWRADTKDRLQTHSVSTGVGYWYDPFGARVETRVHQYMEGQLVIDLVNPKTKQVLWRGSARQRLPERSTPQKRTERINEAVKGIFD